MPTCSWLILLVYDRLTDLHPATLAGQPVDGDLIMPLWAIDNTYVGHIGQADYLLLPQYFRNICDAVPIGLWLRDLQDRGQK